MQRQLRNMMQGGFTASRRWTNCGNRPPRRQVRDLENKLLALSVKDLIGKLVSTDGGLIFERNFNQLRGDAGLWF